MNPIDYLNSSVWATLGVSGLHGIGVIAVRNIPKDTLITDYSLHARSKPMFLAIESKDFYSILPEIKSLILDRNLFQNWQEIFYFYSPNCEQNLQSFCNHSATPNSFAMTALRDIKKGEEVTQDYRQMFQGYKPHELIKKHHTYEKS